MSYFLDIDGLELNVGDRVTYSSGGRYHYCRVGKIVGFTPKMVRVKVGVSTYTVTANNMAKLFNQDKL